MSISTPATPVVVNSKNGTSTSSDPTPLTTQQMLREVSNLEKVFDERMRAMEKAFEVFREEGVRLAELRQEPTDRLKEVLETRLVAMDKALVLLQVQSNKVPSDTDLAVGRLQSLHEEKFNTTNEKFTGINTRFSELANRTEQTSKDNKVAVDAAFSAAKEAVGEQNKSNALSILKSETGFKEQITLINGSITTTNKNVDDKVNDLKDRLTKIESHSQGAGTVVAWIFAGVGAVVGIIGAVILISKL